jgi:hypothetical protein
LAKIRPIWSPCPGVSFLLVDIGTNDDFFHHLSFNKIFKLITRKMGLALFLRKFWSFKVQILKSVYEPSSRLVRTAEWHILDSYAWRVQFQFDCLSKFSCKERLKWTQFRVEPCCANKGWTKIYCLSYWCVFHLSYIKYFCIIWTKYA